MKYMILINHGSTPLPGTPEWDAVPEDEQRQIYADWKALNETPRVTPGLALADPDTATTVRVEDGRTLTTDGPFVELKEAVGGWLVYEADNLDAAIELAARIPAARLGGAIEVRPIVEWSRSSNGPSASTGARSWLRSSASSATSTSPRRPRRRPSRSRPSAGRATACRRTRRAG